LSFFPLLTFCCLFLLGCQLCYVLVDIFALVVLFCDGFLSLKGTVETEKEKRAQRFFRITHHLNIDLNMVLVRRIYLSEKMFFLSNQTEAALRRALSIPFL